MKLLPCLMLPSAFAVALAGSPARAEPAPPALASVVKTYLHNKGDDTPQHFKHALVDLDDDQVPDAIVLLQGSLWCGNAGCRMLVFKGKDGSYTLHSTSSVSREPVRVLPEKAHGWHTLIVNTKGAGDVLMPHGNKHYPANPSLQKPAEKKQLDAAKILIY